MSSLRGGLQDNRKRYCTSFRPLAMQLWALRSRTWLGDSSDRKKRRNFTASYWIALVYLHHACHANFRPGAGHSEIFVPLLGRSDDGAFWPSRHVTQGLRACDREGIWTKMSIMIVLCPCITDRLAQIYIYIWVGGGNFSDANPNVSAYLFVPPLQISCLNFTPNQVRLSQLNRTTRESTQKTRAGFRLIDCKTSGPEVDRLQAVQELAGPGFRYPVIRTISSLSFRFK